LNPALDDTGLDPDGDGSDNLREYLALTDPQSAASRLRATSLVESGEGWIFTWQAVPGKQYRIESSPDMHQWNPAGEVLADSASMSVTVSTETEHPILFFRAALVR
jgi:hypothetical protein